VGQQLTANPGSWTGTPTPTFTYQWLDCDPTATNCSPIQGATASSYTIQSGDVDSALQVVVTGSNNAGSGQASSAVTTVVPSPQQAPVNTGAPQISGVVAVGQQLQADPGSWTGTPTPTFTYQWLDCDGSGNNCSAIVGATASSYTVQASDGGSALEVVVTGSNVVGNNQASSAPTSVVPQAPVNTQVPQISGTVAVGQQVQASSGSWTGSPAPTFGYQWMDCDNGGNNCVAIVGATASSYTIQASDVGSTLEVVVTGSNGSGSSQASSAPTTVVLQAPVNTQVPQISGTVAVGQQLQTTSGNWNGTPSPIFTYQWQDCDSSGNNCVAIVGATASSYTIQASDVGFTLRVVVTGSNTAGSSQASSAQTTVVQQAPANTQVPQISGAVAVGQQLQASSGNWTGSPAPTFTYQWQDCDGSGNNCVPIVAATASSYTIQASDVGFTLEVVVTGSNVVGSSQASSAPTVVVTQVQPPVNTQVPQISGTVAIGQQLQATSGNWTGSPTFSYQWQDCDSSGNNCAAIVGATVSSYTIQVSDVGFTLKVVVTGTNGAGSSQASSAQTTVVQQAPANTQVPQISGTVAIGQQLQASSGNWTGTPSPTFTYQWQDCNSSGNNCVAIVGATASGYTIQASDAGFTLEVVVTGSNVVGSSQASAAPTAVVTQAPANTQVPQITGAVAVGLQVQASSGNWNGTPSPTFTYQWQDCDSSGNNCVAIVGATASSYTIQLTDGGFTLKVVVTGSNTAGSSQAVSAPTIVVTKPPTAPVRDNFNRANGNAGSNWTVIKSSGFALMNVSANTAVDASPATLYAWNYWNAANFGPDLDAYATVASYGADVIRIGARVTVNTSYSGYFVSVSATGVWSIIRIDNGTANTLATGPTQTLASGDKIAIRIVGSVVTALHYTSSGGWQQVMSYDTTPDAIRYTGAGRVAIEFRYSAIDDFGAG
jgi:hypothetical protein